METLGQTSDVVDLMGCDVPGCDRELHEGSEPRALWNHRVSRRNHESLRVDVGRIDGAWRAEVYLRLEATLDADQTRALAGQLRRQADALEADASYVERRARSILRPLDAMRDLEG